jgi:hypothetical protein
MFGPALVFEAGPSPDRASPVMHQSYVVSDTAMFVDDILLVARARFHAIIDDARVFGP